MADPLFAPYDAGRLQLRNRVVMPAMQRGFCREGAPTADMIEYLRQRAAGGVALIISESCAVDHPSATGQAQAARLNAHSKPMWARCIEAVHAEGASMFMQLWHEGALRETADGQTLGPSGLAHAGRRNGRAATTRELEEIRDSFIRAARDAAEIGADGVELHACHGYFLDQCLWDETNRRDDRYGGASLFERSTLHREIVEGIRDACPENFVISFRFSQWKEVDYEAKVARQPADLAAMVQGLAAAGVDLLHASTRRFWLPEWPPDPRGLAAWTKELSGLPVIAVGSVGLSNDVMTNLLDDIQPHQELDRSLQLMRASLSRGEFDFIAIGRSLIGDPNWLLKVQRGDLETIRTFTKSDLGKLEWDMEIVKAANSARS